MEVKASFLNHAKIVIILSIIEFNQETNLITEIKYIDLT